MNSTGKIFKIGETFICTDFLEKTIRNKNFFSDWCSVSSFDTMLWFNK